MSFLSNKQGHGPMLIFESYFRVFLQLLVAALKFLHVPALCFERGFGLLRSLSFSYVSTWRDINFNKNFTHQTQTPLGERFPMQNLHSPSKAPPLFSLNPRLWKVEGPLCVAQEARLLRAVETSRNHCYEWVVLHEGEQTEEAKPREAKCSTTMYLMHLSS